ncbi:MAG: hypothetical protein JWR57_1324 [Mycetocola sp.]|nr:hypothetical protein [Mycetocola sp.]
MIVRFTAPLWTWQGNAPWFFVTVPEERSGDIRDRPRMPRGFGAVNVRVTVGGSTWDTRRTLWRRSRA